MTSFGNFFKGKGSVVSAGSGSYTLTGTTATLGTGGGGGGAGITTASGAAATNIIGGGGATVGSVILREDSEWSWQYRYENLLEAYQESVNYYERTNDSYILNDETLMRWTPAVTGYADDVSWKERCERLLEEYQKAVEFYQRQNAELKRRAPNGVKPRPRLDRPRLDRPCPSAVVSSRGVPLRVPDMDSAGSVSNPGVEFRAIDMDDKS